jgi:beta-glucosidase
MINDSTDCPAFRGYQGSKLVSEYSEGVFVGYRYLEKEAIMPQFPFGHGLSYTTFEYGNLSANFGKDGIMNVTFTLKNTGRRAGAEIVQLYLSPPKECPVPRPVKELKGFEKVNLDPGESTEVNITVPESAFAYYDENKMQWVVEHGSYSVQVGSSSEDIRLNTEISIK